MPALWHASAVRQRLTPEHHIEIRAIKCVHPDKVGIPSDPGVADHLHAAAPVKDAGMHEMAGKCGKHWIRFADRQSQCACGKTLLSKLSAIPTGKHGLGINGKSKTLFPRLTERRETPRLYLTM